MPKQTILRIQGDDEEFQSGNYLSYTNYSEEGTATPATLDTVTLEELADLCDNEAEDRNNHDFVGTHRILAAFLHRQLGRAAATALLFEIASFGGLDAMSGVGRTDGAFADFGIQDCWSDWTLPA